MKSSGVKSVIQVCSLILFSKQRPSIAVVLIIDRVNGSVRRKAPKHFSINAHK